MNIDTKISQLRHIIEQRLTPLIQSDYVLYSLPYYANIGDTLIWEGTLDFLKNVPYKCVGVCGWNDYPLKRPKPGTTILILGGGFFGDVWRVGWQNVLFGINGCEDYPIVVLPQSIHYDNTDTMQRDAVYLAQFKHLTITVRDDTSLKIAQTFFSNSTVLIPDMAFHINLGKIRKWIRPETDKTLYLKRNDKEFAMIDPVFSSPNEVDIRDWPTMESADKWYIRFQNIEKRFRNVKHKNGRPRDISYFCINQIYHFWHRPKLLHIAVEFLSSYKNIVSTRLHVIILSLLLGKSVKFLDNSYGKNSALYRTWLSDCPTNIISQL